MSELKYSELIRGAYDLHVHAAPSAFPRVQDVWEVAADAEAAGMGGFVLKAHEWATGPLVAAVQKKTPNIQIFGGVVLNPAAGGLSPEVVESQLKCPTTKIVWMPTTSSKAHQESDFAHGPTKLFGGNAQPTTSQEGLRILDDEGNLLPQVRKILGLIATQNIVLATGHLSPHEVDIIVDVAIEEGVEKILIQHVDVGIVPIPLEQQIRLAQKGAILEKCLLACTDFGENNVSFEAMAESIQKIGAKSCVLVTDFGQAHNKPPVQALSEFADAIHAAGVSREDMEQMLVANPRKLLGV